MAAPNKARRAVLASEGRANKDGSYPTDTPGRAVAAKAYSTQAVEAGRMSPAQKARIDARANRALGAKFKPHRMRGIAAAFLGFVLGAAIAFGASAQTFGSGGPSPQDQMFALFRPTVPGVSAALESNRVLKASAGSFTGFQVNMVTCATYPCWVMVFDATALPGNGAVTPLKWYQATQNSTIGASYKPPLSVVNGITVGCSTTGPFTLTATAQCTFSGEAQ